MFMAMFVWDLIAKVFCLASVGSVARKSSLFFLQSTKTSSTFLCHVHARNQLSPLGFKLLA